MTPIGERVVLMTASMLTSYIFISTKRARDAASEVQIFPSLNCWLAAVEIDSDKCSNAFNSSNTVNSKVHPPLLTIKSPSNISHSPTHPLIAHKSLYHKQQHTLFYMLPDGRLLPWPWSMPLSTFFTPARRHDLIIHVDIPLGAWFSFRYQLRKRLQLKAVNVKVKPPRNLSRWTREAWRL